MSNCSPNSPSVSSWSRMSAMTTMTAFGPHSTWRLAPAFIVPVTDTKLKASYGTGFKAPTLTAALRQQSRLSAPSPIPICGRKPAKATTSASSSRCCTIASVSASPTFTTTFADLINNTFDPTTFIFVLRECRQGEHARHEVLRLRRGQRPAEIARRLHDHRHARRYRPTSACAIGRAQRELDRDLDAAAGSSTLTATVLHVGSAVEFNRDGSVPRREFIGPTRSSILRPTIRSTSTSTVFGRVDNLFNRHYESPFGFDQPGFGVFGGVRVTN